MVDAHSTSGKTPDPQRPARTATEKAREDKVQKQLDEALADSFPASDPVSIVTSHQEDWEEPESKSSDESAQGRP